MLYYAGRLRGYGHVEFSTARAAENALDLDGSYLGKRFIKITTPLTPRVIANGSAEGNIEEQFKKVIRPAGASCCIMLSIYFHFLNKRLKF